MSQPAPRSFASDTKRFFFRGLVVLLPSVLTLWLVVKAYQFIDTAIAQPINAGLRVTLNNTARAWPALHGWDTIQPTGKEIVTARIERGLDSSADARLAHELRAARIEAWWTSHWYMNRIGLVVAILAVYIAGRILGGFFGRRIYRKIESVMTTVPILKQVYPYLRQIVDFLFGEEKTTRFNRVVAVEYPRKGLWSVGFLTGVSMRQISDHAGDAVSVFIPSSPTPFTGYTIVVPRADIIDLPITVEEAIRYAVSAGVLVPEKVASTPPAGDKAPAVDTREVPPITTEEAS